jgi:hypothetical protein
MHFIAASPSAASAVAPNKRVTVRPTGYGGRVGVHLQILR